MRCTALRDELGHWFIAVEVDPSAGNADGIPRTAHSLLTLHRVDRDDHPTAIGLARVLAFFRGRLGSWGVAAHRAVSTAARRCGFTYFDRHGA